MSFLDKRWLLSQTTNDWLRNTVVKRRGVTAKEWYGETNIVIASGGGKKQPDANSLCLHFDIPSKGGGETTIKIFIPPQDFPTLLALMSEADSDATIKAMADELQYQICARDSSSSDNQSTQIPNGSKEAA